MIFTLLLCYEMRQNAFEICFSYQSWLHVALLIYFTDLTIKHLPQLTSLPQMIQRFMHALYCLFMSLMRDPHFFMQYKIAAFSLFLSECFALFGWLFWNVARCSVQFSRLFCIMCTEMKGKSCDRQDRIKARCTSAVCVDLILRLDALNL